MLCDEDEHNSVIFVVFGDNGNVGDGDDLVSCKQSSSHPPLSLLFSASSRLTSKHCITLKFFGQGQGDQGGQDDLDSVRGVRAVRVV